MFYPSKNCLLNRRHFTALAIGALLMCFVNRLYIQSVFQVIIGNTRDVEGYKSNVRENPHYLFNCSNIHLIQLEHALGHGWRKEGFLGDFNGTKVVVKLGTNNIKKSSECINMKKDSDTECVITQTTKYLMKEILLSEQLNHPGLARMLGYCVRHDATAVDSLNITDHGVVSVFEIGNGSVYDHTKLMSWKEKIERAAEIADFLNYMEHTPIGSAIIADFRYDHFLLINNRFKLIDLDDISGYEPRCSSVCQLGVCHEGFCNGFNSKYNLNLMYNQLYKPLLNLTETQYPLAVAKELVELFSDLKAGQLKAADVQLWLQNMLKIQNTE